MTSTNRPRDQGRGPRLGTQLRGEMANAYAARGHSRADLILHYSPKCKKDVALSGLLQFLNFLYCEVDTTVKTINYTPYSAIASAVGEPYASLVSAEITLHDGRLVWRRLIQSEPDAEDLVDDLRNSVGRGAFAKVSALQVWTFDQLTTSPLRLRNALRAVAWISAARHWPLAQFKRKVLDLVECRGATTFDEILALEEGPHRALIGAAALDLACNGVVRSDLAEVPLHALTRFHFIGD